MSDPATRETVRQGGRSDARERLAYQFRSKAVVWLSIIVFVGAGLRLLVAAYLGNEVVPTAAAYDQVFYHDLAQSLLAGRGYSFSRPPWPFIEPGAPTAYTSFLYPPFIALVYWLFGVQPLLARLLQAVICSLMPLQVYGLVHRLTAEMPAYDQEQRSRVALLSAALAAGYAYFIYFSGTLMTEGFYLMAVLWALTLTYDLGKQPTPRRWLTWGVAVAMTSLLRQVFMPMSVVLLGYIVWRQGWRIQWRNVILAICAAAALILPWTWRNYRIYGRFLLLNSQAGQVLWNANHPGLGTDFENAMFELPEDLSGANEAEINDELLIRGLALIASEPGRFLRLSLSRAKGYFKFWPSETSATSSNFARTVSFGLLLPFMIAGMFEAWRFRRSWILLYSFAAVYALLHLVSWAQIRYRMPIDVVLLPFAAFAMNSMLGTRCLGAPQTESSTGAGEGEVPADSSEELAAAVQASARSSGWETNLGRRRIPPLRSPAYPDAGAAVRGLRQERPSGSVDVLLVNPPSPDGAVWIRSQHRVGRRSREELVWPQVSLAQLAAMLEPDYSFAIVDAIAERMTWGQFERLLHAKAPRYYITQCTAPTLTNDMYGVMLAKSLGAVTIAFGTHVTPMPVETMLEFPALDFVLRGEPELTFRELIDVLEGRQDARPEWVQSLLTKTDPNWQKSVNVSGTSPRNLQLLDLSQIKGLVWRYRGEVRVNPSRPFIPELDDLPLPRHDLLPIEKYRMPLLKGPFSFVVTARGCPAGCRFCIKHVSYQWTVRLHSPERIMRELWMLHNLGVRNVNFYADLFTVNRDQVMELCERIIDEKLPIRWMCNSRVDYVDREMLQQMARSGCWLISWGIESGSEAVLKQAAKGIAPTRAREALRWAAEAGIKNWGYFIIGLPGETEATIRQTIEFAKSLPLELALFHVAAPYPGTPFFFEVVEKGWFRPGTRWESVDMDRETVLDYGELKAEDLLYWQRRAFREWAFRPGPLLTYARMLASDPRTFGRALRVGAEHLAWLARGARRGREGDSFAKSTGDNGRR